MADGAIDSLSIEIGASSTKAVEDIKKLADSLKALKSAQQSVKSGNTGTKSTFQNISDSSIQAMSKIDLLRKKLGILKQDLNKKMSLGKIDDKGFVNAALQIKNVEAQIDRTLERDLKAAQNSGTQSAKSNGIKSFIPQYDDASNLRSNLKQISKELKGNIKSGAQAFGNFLKEAARHAQNIAKSILSFAGKQIKGIWDKSAFGSLEKSLGRVRNVINSFSRIAFYRAIRSAIKYVTDSLKEGVENAYHYSKEFGDATGYIAEAYDRIASSEFKMSNQLGAAWATMIAYIEPIIIKIINLVTRAADAVTQFFAIMSGKGTYLKAVDYNKDWAESATGAAKAAKEWKNQLLGFDEINRLEEPSDGGGGGGGKAGLNYGDMFEETAKNVFFEQLRDAFENGQWALMGQLLGEKFNEIVDMVDWAGYGKKLGRGLQASITVAYNFLTTADFKNLGARISEFINNALYQVNFDQAGRTWMRLRLTLLDFLLGIADGLNWKMLAIKLSNFITGSLDELATWLKGKDPVKVADALKDFFGNIKYKEIYEKLKEVLKNAFDLLSGVVGELLPDDIGDKVKDGIVNAIKNADFAALHNVISYQIDKAIFGEDFARRTWYNKGEFAGRDIILGTEAGIKIQESEFKATLQGYITDPVSQALYDMEQNGTNAGTNLTNEMSDMASNVGTSMSDIRSSTSGVSDSLWDVSLNGSNAMANLSGAIDGVSGAAWSMAQNGSSAMSEMDRAVYNNGQNMVTNLNTIRDAAAEAWSWLKAVGDKGQARIDANGGIWASLGGFATGGFPEDGLFMANHGELVGKFSNGRTAVANNEQIVAGISAGVFDAVVAAFSQTGGNGDNDRPVNIYLDGKLIAQSTTRYQTQHARAMGA